MQKHKELREKFGNVLPTDNAVEVLESIEQWLIERESQALRIHDVIKSVCRDCNEEMFKDDLCVKHWHDAHKIY